MNRNILHFPKTNSVISIIKRKMHNILGHNQHCFQKVDFWQYCSSILKCVSGYTMRLKIYDESVHSVFSILILFYMPFLLAINQHATRTIVLKVVAIRPIYIVKNYWRFRRHFLYAGAYLSIFIELYMKTEKILKHNHMQAHVPLAKEWQYHHVSSSL